MTSSRKITVELSAEAAEKIDAKVAAGVYEDAEAFVMESVESNLSYQDPAIERWLHEQVVPTYDRMKRDGPAGLRSEQVFGGIKARYLARNRSE